MTILPSRARTASRILVHCGELLDYSNHQFQRHALLAKHRPHAGAVWVTHLSMKGSSLVYTVDVTRSPSLLIKGNGRAKTALRCSIRLKKQVTLRRENKIR